MTSKASELNTNWTQVEHQEQEKINGGLPQ